MPNTEQNTGTAGAYESAAFWSWTEQPRGPFTISKKYFKSGNKGHGVKYILELESVKQKRECCFSAVGYIAFTDMIFPIHSSHLWLAQTEQFIIIISRPTFPPFELLHILNVDTPHAGETDGFFIREVSKQ